MNMVVEILKMHENKNFSKNIYFSNVYAYRCNFYDHKSLKKSRKWK